MTHLETPADDQPAASPLAMTRDERERFLADVHVGVLVHRHPSVGAPIASPVWYSYDVGGDVVVVTSASSLKARVLADAGSATFLVQREAPPQSFVSVSGSVRVTPGADDDVRRTIAVRYLPAEAVDGFLTMTPGDQLVTVRLTPTVWRSSDFGKLAGPSPAS